MQGKGRPGVHCHEQLPGAPQTNKGKSPSVAARLAAVPGGRGRSNGLARKSARMKKFFYAAAAALALLGADARAAHQANGVRVGPDADETAAEAPAQPKPKKDEKKDSKSSSSSEKPREAATVTPTVKSNSTSTSDAPSKSAGR